jgi:FMN phosphatase YigB (HAD superfamily)
MREIKLIIFDLDGTLYDLNDVIQMNYQMQVSFFSEITNISIEDSQKILKDNDIFPTISKLSKSATEFFFRYGISKEVWTRFREEHFDVTKINKTKAVKQEWLKEFSFLYPCVLLSSNSIKNIHQILLHIGISEDIFSTIICSDNFCDINFFNKKTAINHISELFCVESSNILSIGDRYKTDIQPIIELGGYGVQVSAPDSLQFLLADLKEDNLHSCPYYVLYS